jgi:hypothetical protein
MANETIQLRAKAKTLGIDGYRKMSTDELRQAISTAERGNGGGKSAPAKSSNGNGRKSAPAKSAAKKSAPAKSSGKSAPAKKSAASKSTASKGTAKSAPAKSAKSGTAKRPTAGGAKVTTPKSSSGAGRVSIDKANVDWKAETRIGQSGGNRETIMKAVRKFNGNVEKVYNALADKAQAMYPKTQDGRKRSKADAQTLLRWHISRVIFDFVKDTGQHNGATRSNGSAAKSAAPAKKSATSAKKSAASASKSAASAKASAAKSSGKSAPAKKSSAASRKRK